MSRVRTIPHCDRVQHLDRFANSNGFCTCLNDTDFGEASCPFFKPVKRKKLTPAKAPEKAKGGKKC